MFDAVEQQDFDGVQILLHQCTPEELDLNTPNSEGLTVLDIAILTNNVPIAKILLKAGAKESLHCKYSGMQIASELYWNDQESTTDSSIKIILNQLHERVW